MTSIYEESSNEEPDIIKLKTEGSVKIEELIAQNNQLKKKISDYELSMRKRNLIIFSVEEMGRKKFWRQYMTCVK